MVTLKSIADRIAALLDPEIRGIRGVVRAVASRSQNGGAAFNEYDQVFVRRLAAYPKALSLAFWKDHFEWKALGEYPQIKGCMLDFGCGTGHSDILLARSGRSVHGIDISPLGIAIANHLRSGEDETVRGRLSFSVADVARDLPAGGLFDSAWASHVFEHIAEPGPVLTGLRRWLKPAAWLLISVPLGHAYDDPGHVNHFTGEENLSQYLRKYVQVARIDVSEEFKVLRALCRFRH